MDKINYGPKLLAGNLLTTIQKLIEVMVVEPSVEVMHNRSSGKLHGFYTVCLLVLFYFVLRERRRAVCVWLVCVGQSCPCGSRHAHAAPVCVLSSLMYQVVMMVFPL